MSICLDSPLEDGQPIIDYDELSDDNNVVTESSSEEERMFKSSPIDYQHPTTFDFSTHHDNSEENVNEDIELPQECTNIMIDVLEHIMTEVSATSSSSSSSSSSSTEPAPESLDLVPESPHTLLKSASIVTNSSEKPTKHYEASSTDNDKHKNIIIDNTEESKHKEIHKLSLVCNKNTKSVEPSSDISTPSPIEEMVRPQLCVAQTASPSITSISHTMTATLSTMSLLSSAMAKHVTKGVTMASSTTDGSEEMPKKLGEEKSLNTSCTPASTTVNACADFFNALLKSDKTLTSVSNQGN